MGIEGNSTEIEESIMEDSGGCCGLIILIIIVVLIMKGWRKVSRLFR